MRAMIVAFAAVALLAALSGAAASPYTTRLVKERWQGGQPQGWTRGPRAHADTPLEAHVFVRQTNLDVLEEELNAVSDPRSPRYGQHLTLEQVNRLVAPRPESVIEVLSWLQYHGVDTSRDVSSNGNADALRFRTTVRVMEALLGAEYYLYRHEATGSTIVRTHERYSLPDEVHRHIDFVGPTVRFPSTWKAAASPKSPAQAAMDGVTPDFLRQLYSVGNYSAQSPKSVQGVASFLGQFMSQDDLKSFFQQYAPANNGNVPTIIGPNTPSQPGVEASLDIEYIMSVGQGVTTQFWSTPGQQPGNPGNEPFLTWLFNLGNATDAPWVISSSYGDNENSVNYDYAVRVNAEFQKAGVRGISLLYSSGDGGVGGGQPSFCQKFIPTFPAGSPYVTAVGGTTSSNPEVAASLSSGGFSDYWPRPSYQASFVEQYFKVATGLPSSSLYNATGAGFPDVSAQAQDFIVVQGGFSQGVDGTSCSAPTFSGVVALLNDARFAAGKGPLGYLNHLFYQNPGAFNDVTSGNNPGCFTNGFNAAAGWDPVTGLGTPNFAKLRQLVLSLP